LVAVVLLALSFALLADNILSYITSMIATLMSGMCVVSLLGRFWPRLNAPGALAALASAPLISLAILWQPALLQLLGNPVLPTLVGAAAVAMVVSLLTPAVSTSRDEALAILSAQRASMEGRVATPEEITPCIK